MIYGHLPCSVLQLRGQTIEVMASEAAELSKNQKETQSKIVRQIRSKTDLKVSQKMAVSQLKLHEN